MNKTQKITIAVMAVVAAIMFASPLAIGTNQAHAGFFGHHHGFHHGFFNHHHHHFFHHHFDDDFFDDDCGCDIF